MKFNDVSFPHPVLGLNDSINGNIELQNPEINSLQDIYKIIIKLHFNNDDLKKILGEGKAEYYCEVTCTNTLYRQVFLSDSSKIEIEIPKKEVKGRVEFTCLLVAKKDIEAYFNTDAHLDYQGHFFDLERGDILAYFGEFSFNADIKYEKLKAVSSFMEVVGNEDLTYTNIDLKKNKIEIQLPSDSYNIFSNDIISQEERFAAVFHSSLVLNALLTALYNFEDHKDYLWAKVIEYRLKNEPAFKTLSIDEKENIPEIAQRLLGNPFTRLLDGLNVILESSQEE
ncbi:hypothetical protein [Pedobacter sp.]|uniref:hypothetical protein n=1 Tax=Pedobacter sp. TaxID=1411316 RepID=UPI00396C6DF7